MHFMFHTLRHAVLCNGSVPTDVTAVNIGPESAITNNNNNNNNNYYYYYYYYYYY